MPMVSHNYKVYSRIAGGFIFVTSTSLGISVTRKIRDLEQSLAVLSLRIERSVIPLPILTVSLCVVTSSLET